MRTVKKAIRVSELSWEMDEPRASEPRVRLPAPGPSLFTTRLTKRMKKVDSLVFAIACGNVEPDGTPIPVAKPTLPVPQFPSSAPQLRAAMLAVEIVTPDDGLIQVRDSWLVTDGERKDEQS